jgi:hypothetical protein
VRQGDTLSPTLFGLFINDLAIHIKGEKCGIKIGDEEVSILLYADDIVLLSSNQYYLQHQINELRKWCEKWRLLLNVEK